MVPLAIEAAQVKAIGEVKTTSLGAGWLCRGVEQPSDRLCRVDVNQSTEIGR